jgi:hypothetical protein
MTAAVQATTSLHVTLGSFAALRMTGISIVWDILPREGFCLEQYWFLPHPNPYKLS